MWISLKFVSEGQFDDKSALVWVIASFETGNKQWPQPVMAKSNDKCTSLGLNVKNKLSKIIRRVFC